MSRLTSGTRTRLGVFAALTAATVGYSAVSYVDVSRLAGVGYYDMEIELADGQGLYPGSLVTLSGVEVGEVTGLRTSADGVLASVIVEDSARIPRSSRVEVRSISAAGEQYVDIAAPSAGSPVSAVDGKDGDYGDGDTIPVSASHTTITTAQLLRRLDGLVESIPLRDLHTTLDEVGVGLSDGGRDLGTFLDALLPLQEEFTRNLDPTEHLVARSERVLITQAGTGGALTRAAAELARFTRHLEASDSQLRGSIDHVPAVTDETVRLIEGLDPALTELLVSSAQLGEVTATYDTGIRHALTVLPGVVNGFQTALNSSPLPGAVSLFARSVVNDPPACTTGFVQERRSPRETSPMIPPTSVYCQVAPGSEQAVRGARNYPCPNSPQRGPSAVVSCGLRFQDAAQVAQVQGRALDRQVDSANRYLVPGAAEGTSPYTSLATAGSASPLELLASGQVAQQSTGWQSLILGPLGLS